MHKRAHAGVCAHATVDVSIVARSVACWLIVASRFGSLLKGSNLFGPDMSAKKQKGANLLELGRQHYASKSAMAHLLDAVKMDGPPPASSRNTQYRRRKAFCNNKNTHGSLVCKFLVAGVTVAVQNPAAMLHHCAMTCNGFRQLVEEVVARHGVDGPPWSLILYADGVSPADTLCKHDARKFYAVYWSFKEFGHRALAFEETWFVLAVIRTTELEKITGGLSHLMGALFDTFFFSTSGGTTFATSGVMLTLAAGPFLLRCALRVIVGDEPALKDILNAKGHAGVRFTAIQASPRRNDTRRVPRLGGPVRAPSPAGPRNGSGAHRFGAGPFDLLCQVLPTVCQLHVGEILERTPRRWREPQTHGAREQIRKDVRRGRTERHDHPQRQHAWAG